METQWKHLHAYVLAHTRRQNVNISMEVFETSYWKEKPFIRFGDSTFSEIDWYLDYIRDVADVNV